MSSKTRIYVVTDREAQPVKNRLVRAPNQAQAIAHVTAPRFLADVADQDTLVSLTAQGIKVEAAGEESGTNETKTSE